MDFKKKIIAFDLDGTLTISNQKMDGRMAEVLETLLSKNRVVVISGAAFSQMQKQMDALLSRKNFIEDTHAKNNLYILPISGLSVYHFEENEWRDINTQKGSFENPQKIVEALEALVASGRFDIPKEGKGTVIQKRSPNQISFAALGGDAPLEEKRVWDPDHKKRQEIKKELEEKIPDIEVSIGGNSTVDILPKGWSKAEGLNNLLQILGEKKENVIFMGDAIFPGGNDYSVKQAGFTSIKVEGPEETAKNILNSVL